MSESSYFSEEYQSDIQTVIVSDSELTVKNECSDDDFERYDISKPRRIIIKAKLLNGKD